ncbi:MAG: hypothetical protein WCO79_02165 [bacterium]
MKNKLSVLALCASLLVATLTLSATAQTVIQVVPASGPALASPNSYAWRTNAARYLETGLLPAGNRTNDPSIYSPNTNGMLVPGENVQSSTTPLWLDVMNPTAPNLAGERGNITYFGVKIRSQQAFRLADLRFVSRSTDTFQGIAQNSLGFTQAFTTNAYSLNTIGIYWGADGIKGTADDVRVIDAPATQLVNELYFVGAASYYVANTQAALDNVKAYITQQSTPFSLIVRYELLDSQNAANVLATGVKMLSVSPTTPAAPTLDKSIQGGVATGSFIAEANRNYLLQRAAAVTGPWNNYTSLARTNAGTLSMVLPPSQAPQKIVFYRLAVEP